MKDASATADEGTAHIVNYLKSRTDYVDCENVEGIKEYQLKDIDLIWHRDNWKTYSVEIKVDNYHHTGNYFFETISNVGKKTPGCFMYSEADFLFYYFLKERELHVMPLKKVREWFIDNQDDFAIAKTSTSVNGSKYYTQGCLVRRQRVQDASLVTIRNI